MRATDDQLRFPRASLPAMLWLALGLLTLLALAAMALKGQATVQQLHGWFWPLARKPLLPWAWLGVVVAGAIIAAWTAWQGWRRPLPVQAAMLVLLGLLVQHGLAWSEGRGIDGLRDRALKTGHAEFVVTASRGLPAWQVLTRYEQLVQAKGQRFARSKPPGQLLSYMALARLGQGLLPADKQQAQPLEGVRDEAHRQALDFATLALPLLASLTALPLLVLGQALLPRRLAAWPALLWVCCAPAALITLHMDQALYPLLACTAWACAARAGTSPGRALGWGLGAGAMAWLCLFVSFSLLPALPLLLLLPWLSARHAAQVAGLGRQLRALGGMLLGFCAPAVLLALCAHYDMLERYRGAMAHHQRWKHWEGGLGELSYFGGLNLLEFTYWLGVPVAACLLWGAGAALLRWRQARPAELLALATTALLLVTAALGRTKGEVARLWMFLVPLALLAAAGSLPRMVGSRRALPVLLVLALTQLAWAVVLKTAQDFW